ncbi:MAG: bifunctional precorrin-2 dehydrogenase/sirohydrochlorin ferrochelatase, partial [Kiritimatiellales bacterium]|nr:bifunctional precorrin-2 dehydrogenase/sirohydrochlorin ferrochelatase [Kiritimatiellales bacterium]
MTNEQLKQKGFPINLLIEGKPCLVVGGGKVALRKIEHLIASGAEVAVVSPEVCDEVGGLIEQNRVTHTCREFEEGDVKDAALVFAATNNRAVNRAVLAACRENGIICSCVDGNWAQSDFTTPAITRHGNLTLSVSTGGHACRQAKLIKNSLAKHI